MLNNEDRPRTGKNRWYITIKALFFGFSKVFESGAVLLILIILTTVLGGLMPTVTIYVGKLSLNAILDVLNTAGGSTEINALMVILTIQLLVLLGISLLNEASSYMNYLMGRRLSLNMSAEIIKRASGLDYHFFENPLFYDMISRAQAESKGKPLILIFKATSVIRGGITFISMGGLIVSFSIPLFTAMLIVGVPLLLVQFRYGEKNYYLQQNRTEDARIAGYVSSMMTARQYVPEILSFGLGGHLFGKWLGYAKRFFQQDTTLQKKRFMAEASAAALMSCSTVVVIGYIIYVNLSRELALTAGDVMMYSGAFAGGLAGLKIALNGISGIYENALFLHNLIEFNKLRPAIEIRRRGKVVPASVRSIELRQVSFKYPGSREYALKNVNITFRRAESVLIVGMNGAGKTTLVKLLARLYDPTEGHILLNGTDIREFDIESLRKSIGIIFQEFIRYGFSAKENIGFGSIENIGDTERITAAAKRAKADIFIEQLADKYDTAMSKMFRGGSELSLGQWQRISLARLFMKDAPVFILDEPTASLDIDTEAHLLREISELSGDRICIVVSHRLFKEGIAQRVVVMDKGRIVETGSYENLLARNSEFSRLSKLYHNTAEQPAEKYSKVF